MGADVDALYHATQCSALMEAIETNRHAIVPWSLEQKADYNVTNSQDQTILHQAVQSASPMTMNMLAECKLDHLDATCSDKSGRTAQDYFYERNKLMGYEPGLIEAWERLLTSLPRIHMTAFGAASTTSSCDKSADLMHIPGAYLA